MLFDYLMERYGENKPILLSNLKIDGLSYNALCKRMKRLTDKGKLKKYAPGIYFIPGESIFRSGPTLSPVRIIRCKYLEDENGICGFQNGVGYTNKMNLTTQVPAMYEIVSNKAKKPCSEIKINNRRIILQKPRVEITSENFRALQFLDVIETVDKYAELEGEELTEKLLCYMKAAGLTFRDLEKYFCLYSDKLYKNLYESGLVGIVLKRRCSYEQFI